MSVKTPKIRVPKITGKNFLQAMHGLASSEPSGIRDRTMSGKDRFLKPFKPYSKSTIIYKEKKGVRGVSPSTPHLMDSGKMLRAVYAKLKGRTSYIVSLSDRGDIGYRHQVGDGVPERQWFGADEKMKKAQKKELQKALSMEMRL